MLREHRYEDSPTKTKDVIVFTLNDPESHKSIPMNRAELEMAIRLCYQVLAVLPSEENKTYCKAVLRQIDAFEPLL